MQKQTKFKLHIFAKYRLYKQNVELLKVEVGNWKNGDPEYSYSYKNNDRSIFCKPSIST